ncbi:hypothetical protein OCB16_24125 [Bacillus cereus]|nr:hypothetical protein [Bacillus cereus]CUB12516.1 hypothetical protein BN2127_JRS1_04303 [Bacillus cereus]SDJ95048.1 pilus assembly protein CpaB [Bacillus sp. cl96]SEB18683.1 pilus assembly protein CpaB [Bacillus sp. cl115]SHK40189.1 pilus assembly protein CpaB [Bacillus sp. cl25]
MVKKLPKKTVSVLIAVGLVATIAGYENYRINSAINPTKVYYSKVDIPPRTKITKDMLQERVIPGDAIAPNAITNVKDLEGKYTVNGFGVSKNSLLYKDKVVPKDELPDAAILNLKKNEVAFPLLVDIETSSGNSIIPDSYVDLYFKGTVKNETDHTEKPIFGRVAKHVRVTSVKDSNATNVFDPKSVEVDGSYKDNLNNEAKNRPLAKIYTFAVSDEENQLLNKGALIGEIIPVASGESYNANVERTNDDLITKWIQDQSYKIK